MNYVFYNSKCMFLITLLLFVIAECGNTGFFRVFAYYEPMKQGETDLES